VSGGKPVILPSIAKELPFLSSDEAVGYAPTAGIEELRTLWKKKMEEKNPTLKGKGYSLPVVTAGLTSGINYLCDLFLDEGVVLLTADPCWDNYSLIVETRNDAVLRQFPLFTKTGIDMGSLKAAVMEQAKSGQVRILLNFPQNPTGYSPTREEAAAICALIRETAEKGADVMVWVDDAYFGLDYEENIEKESLFAFLADIHERVLAVKIDGPTKEDYVWGFRTGFLTFGSRGLTEQHYTALNQKLMGAIRSSISCASTPTQSMLIKSWSDPANENEKILFRHMLEERYRAVCGCVAVRKGHPVLSPLPKNPPDFLRSSRRSNRSRQHMLRTSEGSISLLI
jgi:aspartate/methionine/tyrosine aminotransferase